MLKFFQRHKSWKQEKNCCRVHQQRTSYHLRGSHQKTGMFFQPNLKMESCHLQAPKTRVEYPKHHHSKSQLLILCRTLRLTSILFQSLRRK
uniref:Uncharacterized protein n=1 Tax=Arundo donax TaxID=35708 RepID=A0A0A9GNW1_ARUDO